MTLPTQIRAAAGSLNLSRRRSALQRLLPLGVAEKTAGLTHIAAIGRRVFAQYLVRSGSLEISEQSGMVSFNASGQVFTAVPWCRSKTSLSGFSPRVPWTLAL